MYFPKSELEKIISRLGLDVYLDLSFNNMGDGGAKALAEMLKTNKTLENLKLRGNKIGDDGAKALAQALKTNTSLRSLDLTLNKIGNDGAKAFAEMLQTNTSLENLFLKRNKMANTHFMRAINRYLERNRNIKEFNRHVNEIKRGKLIEEKHYGRLNHQLAELEEALGRFRDYPNLRAQMAGKIHSLYVMIYLKQGDIVSALAYYAKHPELENDALFNLGGSVYGRQNEDLVSLMDEQGFEYSHDDKNKAALAILSQAYQNEEVQRLLFLIAKNIIKEKQGHQAELGVSFLLPEERLALLIANLPATRDNARPSLDEVFEMLQYRKPQELYDDCQRQPLKTVLEQAFGSSEFATTESVMRHPDHFPLKTIPLRRSEGKQEDTLGDINEAGFLELIFGPWRIDLIQGACDSKALKASISRTNETPLGKNGILFSALKFLLCHAQKPRTTQPEEAFEEEFEEAFEKEFEDNQRAIREIKRSFTEAAVKYRAFIHSLKTPIIKEERRPTGFFSRVRHGLSDTSRFEALSRNIDDAQSPQEIYILAQAFFRDENNSFHRNSAASYLLDAFSECKYTPWCGIRPDLMGRFDRRRVLSRFNDDDYAGVRP